MTLNLAEPEPTLSTLGSVVSEETSLVSQTKQEKDAGLGSLKRKENAILVFGLVLVIFVLSCINSASPPILPKHIEETVQASDVTLGALFAVYPGAIVLTSAVLGHLGTRMGYQRLLYLGLILLGVLTAGFGYFSEELWQLFIFRILAGISASACGSMTYSLFGTWFPGTTSYVMGISEFSSGIGYLVGPALSGLLYESYGFFVPYLMFGALAVCVMFTNIIFHAVYARFITQISSEQLQLRNMARKPIQSIPVNEILNGTIYITAVSVIVNIASFAFLEPTLAPYLEETFDMSISQTGLTFSILGVIYALAAPFIGVMSHRIGTKSTMMLGMALNGVGYIFIGPLPWVFDVIEGKTTLQYLVLFLSLFLISVGNCIVYVPSLPQMTASIAHLDGGGIGLVGGIQFASLALGQMIGQVLGAFLTDEFGFRTTGFCFGVLCLIFVPVLGCVTTNKRGARYAL